MQKLILTITIALFSFAFQSQAQSIPPPPGGGGGGGTATCDITADFRTHTGGQWGGEPSGTNPGAYLHANFNSVFPSGITLGTGAHTITFTSAQAVTDYLPAGGYPYAICDAFVNPASYELQNGLVTQLLAATLSVKFDQANPNFAGAPTRLGDLVAGYGIFKDKTVNQILVIANKVLSGELTCYEVKKVRRALRLINLSFASTQSDCVYLTCPF